jgi:hypothetical protein
MYLVICKNDTQKKYFTQVIFVCYIGISQHKGRSEMGYDSWLMSGAYDSEDEEIYIEERTYELMKDEYDPSDVGRMAEAISEASEDDQETIRDYIEQKAWDKLGLKLYTMSYDYMEKFAESAAQREVEQGLHL